jgi:triphosphatase
MSKKEAEHRPPAAPALSTLAASAAEELLAATQAARAPDAAEAAKGLHRLRIACRRLRALISLSRERLPEPEWRPLQRALRSLLRATGPARDWQVLLAETLPALRADSEDAACQALLAEAHQQEALARRHGADALRGRSHLPLLLALERYLLACATAEAGDLRPVAAAVLGRQHRRLRRRARRLDRDDPEALHQLRLRLKAQRYRVELLAPYYPGKAATRYLARLKQLQDQLGRLHDLHVAEQRLRALRPTAPATRALRLQLGRRCAAAAEQQLAAIKGLRLHGAGSRRFWD